MLKQITGWENTNLKDAEKDDIDTLSAKQNLSSRGEEDARTLGLHKLYNPDPFAPVRLRPGQFIGAVWIGKGNDRIKLIVHSKFDNPEMDYIKMFIECYEDRTVGEHMSKCLDFFPKEELIKLKDADDFPIMVVIAYLRELNALCVRHLRRNFKRRWENFTGKVKGKILIGENIRRNAVRARLDRVFCEYQAMSDDILENRILRAALEQAARYMSLRSQKTTKLVEQRKKCEDRIKKLEEEREYLKQQNFPLEEIDEKIKKPKYERDNLNREIKECRQKTKDYKQLHGWINTCRTHLQGVPITHISQRDLSAARKRSVFSFYRIPLNLAKAVLFHFGFNPHGETEKLPKDKWIPTVPYALQTSELFERYAGLQLRKKNKNLKVQYNAQTDQIASKINGESSVCPDYYVPRNAADGKAWIIDAKYKKLNEEYYKRRLWKGGFVKDLKKMVKYSQHSELLNRINNRHAESKNENKIKLWLVYPDVSESSKEGVFIKDLEETDDIIKKYIEKFLKKSPEKIKQIKIIQIGCPKKPPSQ